MANHAVPQSEDLFDIEHSALLVYDMQRGIFSEAQQLQPIASQVQVILQSGRSAKLPIFFCRHMSLPVTQMGLSQMRTAKIWQRAAHSEDVQSKFLRDSLPFQLLPEIAPLPDESVFDKLGMSAFAGTPLDTSLRDLGVTTVLITGVVLEIGILPTVLQAIDLGYIPVVVIDACGSTDEDMRTLVLNYLKFTSTVVITDTKTVTSFLASKNL